MTTAAQQFTEWLERTHPDFFDVFYQHVQQRRQNNALRRASLRGMGQDGTDVSISDPSTFDATAIDMTPVDIPTLTASDLQTPNLDTSIAPGPDVTSALDVSTDNSGSGFLQTLGSGISSAASSVANFITSPQGLSDLTKLGTAYFQLQNNSVNAQLQTQVLQAQITRAQSGMSPVPVTYAMVNGALTPIYSSGALPVTSSGALVAPGTMPPSLVGAITAGQSQLVTLPDGSTAYTVPPSIVGSLSVSGLSGSLAQLAPWLFLIGGGLLVLKLLRH